MPAAFQFQLIFIINIDHLIPEHKYTQIQMRKENSSLLI